MRSDIANFFLLGFQVIINIMPNCWAIGFRFHSGPAIKLKENKEIEMTGETDFEVQIQLLILLISISTSKVLIRHMSSFDSLE